MSSVNLPPLWGGVRHNIVGYKHIVPLGQPGMHVALNVHCYEDAFYNSFCCCRQDDGLKLCALSSRDGKGRLDASLNASHGVEYDFGFYDGLQFCDVPSERHPLSVTRERTLSFRGSLFHRWSAFWYRTLERHRVVRLNCNCILQLGAKKFYSP